ncbi:MAG: gliding motility-associated C-terminal domain-containing protein [Flavobacterium sp.]
MQGLSLFAQKEVNIWYFGNYAGLNFNTNPPTALTNSVMSTYEGSSSIADKNGNLLFYTDGITVWNKNHQIMTNGTGLLGNPSSTHSALVIKQPGVDSMYIIFTSSDDNNSNGVCYSVVNMKLSGQFGAVTTKNIKLVNVSAEKIAAINHANQRDIWIAIPAHSTDSIYTFLVTPLGVNLSPVKNTTGFPQLNYNPGQIKFSNDGTKLAFADHYNYTTIISDFNNLTGVISNSRAIDANFQYPSGSIYGLEFSPNSQYLYLTGNQNKIFQCSIPNSSTNMSNICNMIEFNTIGVNGQLQLGPDGKIYSVVFNYGYVGVINNPNSYFKSCGFNRNGIYLGGKSSNIGLPNYYQTFFSPVGFITAPSACIGDTSSISIKIDSASLDSINWFIGDTITPIIHGLKTTKFKYLNNDTTAKIILAKVYSLSSVQKYYDTLKVFSYPKLNLSNDTSICVGDSIILKATFLGADYAWQDGKTDSVYKVKFTGLYKVISTLNGCSVKDSTRITVNSYPNLNLGKDTLLCGKPSYKLKSTYVGANYLWQDSTADSTYLVTKTGLYWVQVNNKGCLKYDSINIKMRPKPIVNLGNDSLICGDSIFKLKATYPLATNYLWSDNSTDSILTINKRGKYWVLVNDSGCVTKDTISIILKPFPKVNLGNDTMLCQFETIKLNAKFPNAIYKWSDNTIDSNLLVNKAGKYWLMVNDSSCISKDTIQIVYKNLPIINIGNDTIICGVTNYQIKPNYSFTNNYLWSDNSKDSVLTINKRGKYWVQVTDSGCVNKDTISIVLKAFPTINLGNDTMICENKILLLKAKYLNANYLWSDGSKDSILEVNKAGKYWLSINDSSCTSYDSIEIRYKNLPIINIGNDTIVCGATNYQIKPNYSFTNNYLWSDNSKDSVLTISKRGKYWVQVTDSGCVNKDTISIILKTFPNINLGNDTMICENNNLILNANYSNADYLWSDGSKDTIFEVKKAGKYWLSVNDSSCLSTDTIEVRYNKTPTVNLGNDTTLCDNAILLLKVPVHYQSYLWNDLSIADSLLVSKEGLYSVTVNDSGCIAQEEIKVSYFKTPHIKLGNDTSFCEGVPFYLKATNPKTNYLRSNFSTDSVIKITQSGTYWVKVYNACGTSFDTTEIKIEACNCYIYFPNAFTPNGNGLNEVFLPVSNCKITNYQLIILNRWGVKIFESNNPNIGWNGKLNEILQSNEVYVYQLEADLIDNFIGTNKKQVSLKGNVTLLN